MGEFLQITVYYSFIVQKWKIIFVHIIILKIFFAILLYTIWIYLKRSILDY